MRYLTLDRVLTIQRRLIDEIGGSHGVRDMNGVDSAVAQPRQTMFGEDLYPTLPEKAGALGYSLVANHGFVDGNKRVGYSAMEAFLLMNGHELSSSTEDGERVILAVAAGAMGREDFTEWVRQHIVPR
jgi:death-on-curing protein